MKIVVILSDNGILEKNKDELQHRFKDADIVWMKRRMISGHKENIVANIKNENPDLCVVENLEGFDMRTLTDAVAYNLIHCRQIHLLYNSAEWEKKCEALEGQLSLNMFFLCKEEDTAKRLGETYKQIPFIKSMTDSNDIIEEVASLAEYACSI